MTKPRIGLRQLTASPTFVGFAKLAGGSTVAQILVVAGAPVLTRLYSPEDFGALATFSALSAILITVAAGRYELAVMLPDDDDEATQLSALALLLVCVVSAATLVMAAVLYVVVVIPRGWALGAWIFLVPPTVLVGGASAVFVAGSTRRGDFGLIGTTNVVRQFVAIAAQILLGLLRLTPGGLLVGGFLGAGAANWRLGVPVIRSIRDARPSRHDLLGVAARYSRFPRYTLPSGLVSSLYLQGIPLLIGGLFGASTLGVWSLTQRVLTVPLTIVGGAAAESYYKTGTDRRGDRRSALRLFDQIVLGLLGVAAVPLTILAFWGPQLFAFVFGQEWEQAGFYARLMLPLLLARLVASPISRTFMIYERNNLGLWVQGALLAALVGCAVSAATLGWTFAVFLSSYSWISALIYTGMLLSSRRVIGAAAGSVELGR